MLYFPFTRSKTEFKKVDHPFLEKLYSNFLCRAKTETETERKRESFAAELNRKLINLDEAKEKL